MEHFVGAGSFTVKSNVVGLVALLLHVHSDYLIRLKRSNCFLARSMAFALFMTIIPRSATLC